MVDRWVDWAHIHSVSKMLTTTGKATMASKSKSWAAKVENWKRIAEVAAKADAAAAERKAGHVELAKALDAQVSDRVRAYWA
jgi:hypothetical protein